ncbi:MAG: hypothetical protein QM696_06520 [Steroidobacteraceae bacterium]
MRPTLQLLSCALVLALLAGCGAREQPAASLDAAPGSETAGVASEGDPCSLLTAGEVEAAIGPLAGPPYRQGVDGPQAGGGKCFYDTRDLHRVTLDVTWSGGESVMRMLGLPAAAAGDAGLRGKLPLPEGATLAGEWDEARMLSCCEITALLGEQVVAIDFLATELTAEQGAGLLNAALRRLGKPLRDVSGDAGVQPAIARAQSAAGRPKPVAACALLTEADAGMLLGGPVETLPQEQDTRCQYRARNAPKLAGIQVQWREGYRQWRLDRDIAGKAIGALMNPDDSGAAGPASAAPQYAGPWEKAGVIVTDFVALRQDVLLRADIRGSGLANAQKIVSAAAERIGWNPAAN